MTFIQTLVMLFRWQQQGWEVHPIDLENEITGWV
jgi:hypothetical protein